MLKLSNISISLDVPVGEPPEPVAVYLYHPRLRASKDPDPNPILSHEAIRQKRKKCCLRTLKETDKILTKKTYCLLFNIRVECALRRMKGFSSIFN